MPRRLLAPNRLGYRGASLLMYGIFFFVDGLPLLLGMENIEPMAKPATIGMLFWAAGFVVAGAIATITAFKRSPASDKIGFRALFAVGTAWVLFTLGFQVLHLFVPQVPAVGWTSIVINTAIVTKIWIDSGWNEPTEPLRLADRSKP